MDHEVVKIPSFYVPGFIFLSQRMRKVATNKQANMHAIKPHQPPCRRPNYMRMWFFTPFLLNQAPISLAPLPCATSENCRRLPNNSYGKPQRRCPTRRTHHDSITTTTERRQQNMTAGNKTLRRASSA